MGKASGTMDAPPEIFSSALNSSTPNINSNERNNKMNEPAMAKDAISTPNTPNKPFPTNRKANKVPVATRVALVASILPCFFFKSKIIGIDPGISIIANNTINAEKIFMRLISSIALYRLSFD